MCRFLKEKRVYRAFFVVERKMSCWEDPKHTSQVCSKVSILETNMYSLNETVKIQNLRNYFSKAWTHQMGLLVSKKFRSQWAHLTHLYPYVDKFCHPNYCDLLRSTPLQSFCKETQCIAPIFHSHILFLGWMGFLNKNKLPHKNTEIQCIYRKLTLQWEVFTVGKSWSPSCAILSCMISFSFLAF